MKTLKTLIFILFISQISFGQESEKSFIIKTPPFAYLNKDYNIGVEFGKTQKLHYNIGLFKTHLYPFQFFREFFKDEVDIEDFSTSGWTMRLGVKKFRKKSYFESQLRFGRTNTLYQLKNYDASVIIEEASTRNTFQFCFMKGWQYQAPENPFVIDTYIGIGTFFMTKNSVFNTHVDPTKMGKTGYENKYPLGMLVYFGTSIGFDLQKKNKK
jgi:hypothetical protein